jgi:hypothetical protein
VRIDLEIGQVGRVTALVTAPETVLVGREIVLATVLVTALGIVLETVLDGRETVPETVLETVLVGVTVLGTVPATALAGIETAQVGDQNGETDREATTDAVGDRPPSSVASTQPTTPSPTTSTPARRGRFTAHGTDPAGAAVVGMLQLHLVSGFLQFLPSPSIRSTFLFLALAARLHRQPTRRTSKHWLHTPAQSPSRHQTPLSRSTMILSTTTTRHTMAISWRRCMKFMSSPQPLLSMLSAARSDAVYLGAGRRGPHFQEKLSRKVASC